MLEFAERLKKLRIEKGLRQIDIARVLNKGHGAVSAWEKGKAKPSMKTVGILAELLGITEDELLGRTNAIGDEILLYTRKGCTSSKRAKNWLGNHSLQFREIDLLDSPLTKIEFVRLLQLNENGTEALIAERSSIYQKLKRKMDFNELTIRELTEYIQEYPTLLKTPIIHDEKQMQVGFNEDSIRSFIPRARRKHL